MENRVFNEFLSDFAQHNIVECPNCHKRADVRVIDSLKYKYVDTSLTTCEQQSILSSAIAAMDDFREESANGFERDSKTQK